MTTYELYECTCGQGVLLRCSSTYTLMVDGKKEKHFIYSGVCPNCGKYIKNYIGKEMKNDI